MVSRRIYFSALCAVLMFLGSFSSAYAATIYANSSTGSDTTGTGTSGNPYQTFTKAYSAANSGDTINLTGTFSWANSGETGVAIGTGFTIGKSLTIQGQSASSTIIEASSTANTASGRVFTITANVNVTFEDLAIEYGYITSGSGAAIDNTGDGPLTLTDVNIEYDDGSGSFVSGGVYSNGTTVLNRTTIANNTGQYMSALYTAAPTTITNSTIFNNTGAQYGGFYDTSGTLIITNSLMASSSYLYIQGSQAVEVKNSILLGTPGSGGIYYYNFFGTVTDNGNNIVAGESGTGGSTGPFFTNGVNNTTKVSNSTTLTSLGIATTLADNGSTNGVQTLALQSGSQAINDGTGGYNGSVSIPSVDARNLYRDGTPDIGPYEYNASASPPTFYAPSTAASNASAGSISQASTTISWTNGNGTARAVFMKIGTSGSAAPSNTTTYTASSVFGSGSQIGSTGWYAVYNGSGSSVNVSGLEYYDNYVVDVVEYNGYAGEEVYQTGGSSATTTKSAYAGTTIYTNYSTGSDSTGNGSSGNPYKTFTKAYAAAIDGDTLNLSGTFTWTNAAETGVAATTGFTINKNGLTIIGQGAGTTTIQAASTINTASERVFTISATASTTFDNLTLRYGKATTGGCLNLAATTTVLMQGVDLSSCISTSSGGSGIYAGSNGVSLTILNSSLDGNNTGTSGYGGGIFMSSTNGSLIVTNTTMSGNTANGTSGYGGAAIYLGGTGATAYLTNDTFTGNYAYNGTIYASSATVYFKNTILTNNVSNGTANLVNLYRSGGGFTSNGYNLFGTYSTTYFNATTTGDWTDRTGSGTYTLYNASTTGTLSLGATTTAISNGTVYAPLQTGSIGIGEATTTANGSISIPSTDQIGTVRATPPSIGAYEWVLGDTTPPTVSLTAPVSSEATSSTMTLSANASDNVAVAGVTFYINGVKINSEVTSAPYLTTFNTTATSSGTYSAFAVARDTSNNYATSTSVSFVIDNTGPTVSLTTPTSGESTSTTVTLSASTSDPFVSVAGVTFYVDGAKQGSEVTSAPYARLWDSTATSSGSHFAFAVARDTLNNYSTSTSVTFTVANTGATPTLIAASASASGATITWQSATPASSRVSFGLTSTYSTSTAELNIASRVTSHSVTLSELPSCTQFHFAVYGQTAGSDTATSSDQTFKTTGCTGAAGISASAENLVATSTGGTLTQDDLALNVPANFTGTTSAATFQANELDTTSFFTGAGTPSGVSKASTPVFNIKALIDATTTLSTFSSPITVTLSYTPSEISGLQASSLWIYRYDNPSWSALSNCVVDTVAQTVSCTTSNFSDFALFGDPLPSAGGGSTTSQPGNGPIFTGTAVNLPGYVAPQTQIDYPNGTVVYVSGTSTPTAGGPSAFTKNLYPRETDPEVLALQKYLNAHGFVLATVGPGSPGEETEYFGTRTELALVKFQDMYAQKILAPIGLEEGTGIFGLSTREYVNVNP